jgi:CBS domain-containing protein
MLIGCRAALPNNRPRAREVTMTVASILKHKGHDVASVRPTNTVTDITRLLSERKIGAAVVQDAAGQLLGIVSERDVVHAIAAHGPGSLSMTAAQIMTRMVKTATPHTTVGEAMSMMTSGRFRHLPVLENGRLAGIISIGDVVKTRLTQQEHEVDSLKAYVAGF